MTYPIPANALDDRLGFIGTSGSGKTYNAGGLNVSGAITYPAPGFVSLNVDGIGVMSKDEGAAMLLSVLSNPQKKIVGAIADGGVYDRGAV